MTCTTRSCPTARIRTINEFTIEPPKVESEPRVEYFALVSLTFCGDWSKLSKRFPELSEFFGTITRQEQTGLVATEEEAEKLARALVQRWFDRLPGQVTKAEVFVSERSEGTAVTQPERDVQPLDDMYVDALERGAAKKRGAQRGNNRQGNYRYGGW